MNAVEPNEDEGSARLRLRRALLRAPLFSELDSVSMAAVEHELTPMVLPGGAPLFHQGESADAVYLVTSGCLGVFRHSDDDAVEGGPSLLAEITPGNIVGEMSLLSHTKRTRSVAALRDSEVWRLAQQSFDRLTTHHPEVLPTLMRSVAVRNALGPTKRRRQPRTFALLPSGGDIPAARFAVQLEQALARVGGRAQMLDSESLSEEPEWFARCEMDHPCSIAPILPTRDGPSCACAKPTAWSCCTTATRATLQLCRSRSKPPSPARCSIVAASWCCCTKAATPRPARPPASSPAACMASTTMCGSTCRATSTGWRG